MNYILITNIDGTGIDTLICETELDQCDVWLMLTEARRKFDDVKEMEHPPYPIPTNTSLMWMTQRGEYEIRRRIASHTPELASYYPDWDALHPKKRGRKYA